MDGGNGIALDSSGNIYVTGFTYSTNFPVKSPVPYQLAGTTNLYLGRLACTNSVYFNANAFIAKIALAPGSNSLIYSTYFGGDNFDVGEGIAVDGLNQVYVTGFTASTNFPNINAFQKNLNGSTNQALPTTPLLPNLIPLAQIYFMPLSSVERTMTRLIPSLLTTAVPPT